MTWVLALAFILRLIHLNGSFWLDEAAQALEALQPWSAQLHFVKDFQPPLLHLLLKLSIPLSKEEWWLRLIGAVIPGLVTVWATMRVGERLFSKKVGLLAGLLLATDSFHLFYSQELRPYSLSALFAVLSWLILTTVTSEKKQGNQWLLFLITTAAGFFSSYLYPFVFLSQTVYILLAKRAYWIELAQVAIGVGLAGIFWLPMLQLQFQVASSWSSTFVGWQEVVSFTQFKSIAQVFVKLVYGVADPSPSILWVVPMLLILGTMGFSAWLVKQKLFTTKGFLLFCWIFVPVILAFLVSFWTPLLQPKRVLFIWPGVYLGVAWIVTLLTSKHKPIAQVLLASVLCIHTFSILQYVVNPFSQRENWKDLQSQIVRAYPPHNTVIIFGFDEPFAPWTWYDEGTYSTLVTRRLTVTRDTNLRPLLESASMFRHVLVFDYLRDLTDPQRLIEKGLVEYGYTEVTVLDQPLIGFVRVYMRPETVIGALP